MRIRLANHLNVITHTQSIPMGLGGVEYLLKSSPLPISSGPILHPRIAEKIVEENVLAKKKCIEKITMSRRCAYAADLRLRYAYFIQITTSFLCVENA